MNIRKTTERQPDQILYVDIAVYEEIQPYLSQIEALVEQINQKLLEMRSK